MLEIGERLRFLRDHNGLTQEQVAERLGLTPAAYQHYEKGRSLPGMVDVPRLASALEVTPGELFPGHDKTAVPAPFVDAFDKHEPDYGDAIYRRAMDKLGRSQADVLLRFLEFLEQNGQGNDTKR